MTSTPGERDERLLHRLEAFSDLVIGFSLALVAFTLVIPAHTADLFRDAWWIITYFWTFAFIGNIWFNHQRLFAEYFVPRPLSIFLNFVLLSMLGLIVFFVQVFGRMRLEHDRFLAFIGYFAIFGLTTTILGVLFAIGTRERWPMLDAAARRWGINACVRRFVVGAAVLIGVALSATTSPRATMRDVLPLMYCVIAGIVAWRLGMRVLSSRIDAIVSRSVIADHA